MNSTLKLRLKQFLACAFVSIAFSLGVQYCLPAEAGQKKTPPVVDAVVSGPQLDRRMSIYTRIDRLRNRGTDVTLFVKAFKQVEAAAEVKDVKQLNQRADILEAKLKETENIEKVAEVTAAPTGDTKIDDKGPQPYAEEAVKHYNRGVELHQAGFFNKAIEEYRGALETDPRMEEAWSNLGGIYASQRSYPKALEAFEKAVAINPNRTFTLNGMGTVLYAKGKIPEAKEMWKKAFTIDPTFASAYYNYGNALEGEKEIDNALLYYYKALQANSNMADAYYRMGVIYYRHRHYAPAIYMLKRATELEPDAEFSRDGLKTIETIKKTLDSDTTDRDGKPNVIAPATAQPQVTPTTSEVSLPQPTPYTGKKSGLFGHKKDKKEKKEKDKQDKKDKKVDMFIQSSQTQAAPAETESDLKEKPAQ